MRGHIIQRSKGSWHLRYDGPLGVAGKRTQITETVKGSRKEAERVLRERLQVIENGGFVAKDKETVVQFMDRWMAAYVATNCAPRTQMDYRAYITRYIVPTIGPKLLQGLAPRDVQKLYTDLQTKVSAKTVLHLHRVLREALQHGVKWGLLVRNVADATSPPHPKQKQIEMWDVPTIHKFMDVARGSRFSGLYHCAILTGMRRSELCGLRWESVDLDNGRLSVVATRQRITGRGIMVGQPKTARSRRVIALSPDCVALFRTIRGSQVLQKASYGDAWKDSGYAFVNAYGNPVNPDDVSDDFHKLVLKANLPHLTLHGLRHAHATLLLTAGVHAKVVSERLGHSNIAITLDVYSHVLPHVQEEAANKIDSQLNWVNR